MENENPNNSNWNQGTNPNQDQFVQNTPNAKGSFALGIIALCISTICCFCYGSFAGLILSIIGLFLGISAKRKYNENPSAYNPSSFKKAKTGTILNILFLFLFLGYS